MVDTCEGKVAVVVGGTRGIGAACVLALADAGATVVIAGRSKGDAEAVAEAARGRGATAEPLTLDASDPADVERGIMGVKDRFGSVDILVANAGINPYFKRAEHVTPEMWDEVNNLNLRGLFFSVQAAARHMLDAGSGSVVVISSVTATKGVTRGLPYTATKGGLDAMTRTLAVEWADRGVRVNAVAPGYVETDLTSGMRSNEALHQMVVDKVPLGRFGTSEEVAAVVAFLASNAASYITGQVVFVDGGMQAS